MLDQLEGDVVYSPYGLNRALSTIREGATGETRRALERFKRPPEVPGIISAQAAPTDTSAVRRCGLMREAYG